MSHTKSRTLSLVGKGYDEITPISTDVTQVALGENHIVFLKANGEMYGLGSNKFGQLSTKNSTVIKQPLKVLTIPDVKKIYCGAEHTFVINQKNQVFSCGLNIKGQLGHGTFENYNSLQLVSGLLPGGLKNPRSNNPKISKAPKAPIIQTLEKFDLQVKMEDQDSKKRFVLSENQFIEEISCGALFTIARSNQGKVYGCGFQGLGNFSNHDDQLEKSSFKRIELEEKIDRIRSGLAASVAVSTSSKFYLWGRFGKQNLNVPRKVDKHMLSGDLSEADLIECRLGDEFAVFLTKKGEICTMGENFESQLGFDQHETSHCSGLKKVSDLPLVGQYSVGRNSVLAISLETEEIYSWGSNKYGQLGLFGGYELSTTPKNTGLTIKEDDQILASSYLTAFLTAEPIKMPNRSKDENGIKNSTKLMTQSAANQAMVPLKQYVALMEEYRAIKALNLTLLEKISPASRKQSKQSQTYFKLELQGVTQYRKFNSNIQIKWNELQLESQINEGGFGLIYRAKWREITVIVKKFKIENGDVSVRDFLSECNAMEAIRHPNIVMFLGAVTVHPHYSIILEYCSRGSLWSYLQNQENVIPWEERRRLATELAQGCLYLHMCSPPIIHRDLKSLNIFLDENLQIKIGDFGWTKTLQNYMTNKIGTYQWMAPEVIGNKPYSQKADVFSFAIIMWEIASREPPYKNISGAKVSEDVLNRELRPQIPKKCPESWAKLMKRCWEKNPDKRPDFKEVIRQLQLMKL